MDKRLLTNRTNWNERTPIHAASDFYDVESFKSGMSTLNDIELREVGDVSGRTLLHLQCHFGLDTMSWARLGARATGIDFSDVAINLARSLSDELDLNIRFICSNVYDLPGMLDEQFDVVFTSYGVLIWLPDIKGWAEVVYRHLKPGGVFYIVEFHPFADAFELSESGDMVPTYRYFHHELFFEGGEQSYAGAQIIETPTYEWQHTLGEIVCALIDAGLRIEFLHEFPFTFQKIHPVMEQDEQGRWKLPRHNDSYPQTFSIRATRPRT